MAEDTQSDMLTAEVKRIVRQSRHEPGAGAKVCALGDEGITALCTLVDAEAQRKNRLRWGMMSIWVVCAVIRLALIFLMPRGTRAPYEIGALLLGGIGHVSMYAMAGLWVPATDLLARLDDVRAVAPLLDAITAHVQDSYLRDTIRKSLKRLLPRLQASDAERLLPRHIVALNSEVETYLSRKSLHDDEVPYILVVLKALEQVGDETSLESMERVLPKVRSTKVLAAAEECLLFLQSRGALGKHTLLRAASAGSANLLRAAQNSDVVDPNVLLRPTAASE